MNTLTRQYEFFLENSLATSTRRSYSSAQRKFQSFCASIGRLPPCPANEETLCMFVSFLARTLQHPSIKVYLSAVRQLHIEKGHSDPLEGCARLHLALRGIKKIQGTNTLQRLPITNTLMAIIKQSLNLNNKDHLMFWAACSLAYFGLLRAAEFTVPNLQSFDTNIHLQLSDLAFDKVVNPSCMRVFLKGSKTDPFRKGHHIHIGRGSSELCAISAMSTYLHHRGSQSGPLFAYVSGQPLSRINVTTWLRNIFKAAKIPGNFSSHSFRIGAATVAARNGVPDHQIKAIGRWNSQAYLLYTRTSPSSLAALSHLLTE